MTPQVSIFGLQDMVSLMQQAAKQTGKMLRWILRDVGRIWAIDLVKHTFGDRAKSLPGQRRAAQKAIKSELKRLFEPIPDNFNHWMFENRWIVSNRKTKGLYAFFETDWLIPTSQRQMFEQHQKWRKRNGHVAAFAGKQGNRQDNIPTLRKLAVEKKQLAPYIRDVQARVGRAKAGWNAAVRDLGGSVPSWVSGKGTSEGFVDDSINEGNISGALSMGNNVPYVRDDSGFMARLLSKRRTDLQKGHYLKRLEKALAGKAATT